MSNNINENYIMALKYLGPKNIEGFEGPMGWLDTNVLCALKIAAGIPDMEGKRFIDDMNTGIGL